MGGLNAFVHRFLCEVLVMVRAHCWFLGGNALLSFKLTHTLLFDNSHKHQVSQFSFSILLLGSPSQFSFSVLLLVDYPFADYPFMR